MTAYDDARAAIAAAEAQHGATTTELAGVQASLSAAQAQVTQDSAVIGDLKRQVADLTSQLTAAKAQIPAPAPTTVIGMSSPANLWDQRLSEVGPSGVKARRIYADVSSSGISQMNLITAAVAAGMTPCVSFKFGGGTIAQAGAGAYNAWVTKAAQQLQALGVPVLVACWHEPFDDMTGPEFLAIQRQVLPILNAQSNLSTFCILHGWLLDNRMSDFTAYMTADVLGLLDLFGVDSYQSGTNAAPGNKDLSTRMPALLSWLKSMGAPDKPLIVGEFSAYTAASLTAVGETILDTPNVKYALLFDSSTGGKGEPLVPGTDRMSAFKATKADPRAKQ